MAVRIPLIAIVGRPNVGKSTLFNRIVRAKKAIVEDIPGVTRDRNYAYVDHFSVPFYIVDTGGFEASPEEDLQAQVVEQALVAAEEADSIIALFDAHAGLRPGDEDVVDVLRRYNKPKHFVVNKCDGLEQAPLASEFYELGVDTLFELSALHGRGVRRTIEEILAAMPNYQALLDSKNAARERDEELEQAVRSEFVEIEDEQEALESLDEDIDEERLLHGLDGDTLAGQEQIRVNEPVFAPVYEPGESDLSQTEYERMFRTVPLSERPARGSKGTSSADDDSSESSPSVSCPTELELIRLAVIGRPNVGKSTLVNTLSGEHRALTSPIAGTTRDSLDLSLRRDGQDYVIIDTAGLRKKAKVLDQVERYSVLRAISAVRECDVAIVLIDAERGASEQDAKIVGLAHERGKSICLVVNKWDLILKDHTSMQKYKEDIKETFKFSPYAPILFVSAKTGKRCPKIIDTAKALALEREKRISTAHLNYVLQRASKKITAPSYRGRTVKLYFAAQIDTAPPRFALYFNFPRQVHFSYLRFLKNTLRSEFGFEGQILSFHCASARKASSRKT